MLVKIQIRVRDRKMTRRTDCRQQAEDKDATGNGVNIESWER